MNPAGGGFLPSEEGPVLDHIDPGKEEYLREGL